MPASALIAQNLTLGYGTAAPVLDGLSLTLRPGDFVAILGPNGSGKSTLLAALTGTLMPRVGAVTLDGTPLAALTPMARARRLAVVPQSENTPEDFSALEISEAGRFAHDEPRAVSQAKAREALAATDLTAKADRPFGELSAGERQRVLLARALAQEADYLFCDEPVTNLDPAHQWSLYEVLRQQAAQGRAVVVLEHQVMLVRRFAARAIILAQGAIIHDGPAAALTPELLSRAYHLEPEVARHFLGAA